jgi:hypothetical protein
MSEGPTLKPVAPGTGRVRYGAAMALYAAGRITADQLEVYRICSALDAQDPAAVFAERRVPMPDLPAPDPAALIRHLVEEADLYLSTLPGPGVAEVRAGLAPWRDGPCQPAPGPANAVVARHLPKALAASASAVPGLAAAFAAAAPHLNWITYDLYDPALIGADFATGHAYASLVGEQAPIPARDFDLGVFLIAPDVLYRDHAHAAPELYAPLTGPHGWRFGPGSPLQIRPAHQPVWNPPHQPHMTKVGPVPFLCLFAWTRDVNAPAYVLSAEDWTALEDLRL